jgi:predicted aconitase
MIPEAKLRFEQTDLYQNIRKSGVKVFSHCPLSALTVQISRKKVLTPSGKLFYYLKGAEYSSLDECIKTCREM